MSFKYHWSHNEANFGPPVAEEIPGGTHVSFEIILKYGDKFIALRRPEAIPDHETPEKALNASKAMLYFIHALPRWGETPGRFIERAVQEQAGVRVENFKFVHLDMEVYEPTQQWAITPYVVANLETLPEVGIYGNGFTEVVQFDKANIPNDFGWWESKELENMLIKHLD